MWTPDPDQLIKVFLHSQGEDPETPWAEDLGPDPVEPGRRLVQLGNVPFLHAKPTYEDVIAVAKDESGRWAWDSQGKEYDEIVDELLVEDGGRWAMIVDYALAKDSSCGLDEAFGRLDQLGESNDIAVEGCYSDDDAGTGRAYLAVPSEGTVDSVMTLLAESELPLEFELVHPLDD